MEACSSGHAFDPHRHDTYAVGVTLSGVQSFRYRGADRNCTPGQVFVLHPDELHDGHAGTSYGFRYWILYVEPRLVSAALEADGGSLPFVRDPVSDDQRPRQAITPAFDDSDAPLEDLRRDQIILDLAQALAAADPSIAQKPVSARHRRAVEVARELLDADLQTRVTSAALEAAAGLTRYELARQFRACLGTKSVPLSRHAPPRRGARADPRRHFARRGGLRLRLRRPEPHDAALQESPRTLARSLGLNHRLSG